jgi:hypothetical protein
MNRFLFLFFSMLLIGFVSFSQKKGDTLLIKNDSIIIKGVDSAALHKPADTPVKKKHSPRKAAIRSAIIPGWGQAYNRKYWKLPIVYGALGTTAYIFRYNVKQYNEIQFAYKVLVNKDSANFPKVAPALQPFIAANASNDLFNARSEVRQNIDYSALVFLFFWALNVVDAVVDAHLKDFDVSPEITFKIKPGFNPDSNTTGLTLAFNLHKAKNVSLPIFR